MGVKNAKASSAARVKWLAAAAGIAAAAAAVTMTTPASAATVRPASSPCSTTSLQISFGKAARTATAQQYRVRITLRNRGTRTCNLDGYPGMDLVGDGGDMRLPVAREGGRYAAVTLRPGQAASFTLTYVLETAREIQGELGAWGPNSVVITAPNSTSHQTLKWTLGPVAIATPTSLGRGTYLSPVA